MELTQDQEQKIINTILSSLKTNSRTIDNLTDIDEVKATDYFELNRGRKASCTVVSKLITTLVSDEIVAEANRLANESKDMATKAAQSAANSSDSAKKSAESAKKAEDEATKAVTAAEAATPRVVNITELDTLGQDSVSKMVADVMGSPHTRFKVTNGGLNVGVMDVIGDSQNHVVTEILTTYHLLTDEGQIDVGSHKCGIEPKIYWRAYNINSPALNNAGVPKNSWCGWAEAGQETRDALASVLSRLDSLEPIVGNNSVRIEALEDITSEQGDKLNVLSDNIWSVSNTAKAAKADAKEAQKAADKANDRIDDLHITVFNGILDDILVYPGEDMTGNIYYSRQRKKMVKVTQMSLSPTECDHSFMAAPGAVPSYRGVYVSELNMDERFDTDLFKDGNRVYYYDRETQDLREMRGNLARLETLVDSVAASPVRVTYTAVDSGAEDGPVEMQFTVPEDLNGVVTLVDGDTPVGLLIQTATTSPMNTIRMQYLFSNCELDEGGRLLKSTLRRKKIFHRIGAKDFPWKEWSEVDLDLLSSDLPKIKELTDIVNNLKDSSAEGLSERVDSLEALAGKFRAIVGFGGFTQYDTLPSFREESVGLSGDTGEAVRFFAPDCRFLIYGTDGPVTGYWPNWPDAEKWGTQTATGVKPYEDVLYRHIATGNLYRWNGATLSRLIVPGGRSHEIFMYSNSVPEAIKALFEANLLEAGDWLTANGYPCGLCLGRVGGMYAFVVTSSGYYNCYPSDDEGIKVEEHPWEKIANKGETQKRFASVTAENFADIRVGDVIDTNELVMAKKTSKITVYTDAISSPLFTNGIYEYNLADGVVTKTTSTNGLIKGIPTVRMTKAPYQDVPTVSMMQYMPTGSKFGATQLTGEKTVLSCTGNGKVMQVLDGPELHRFELKESGDEQSVSKTVYSFRREISEEEKAEYNFTTIEDFCDMYKPGNMIDDRMILHSGAVRAGQVGYPGMVSLDVSAISGETVAKLITECYSSTGTWNVNQEIRLTPRSFTSVTAENLAEIQTGDRVSGLGTVVDRNRNDITYASVGMLSYCAYKTDGSLSSRLDLVGFSLSAYTSGGDDGFQYLLGFSAMWPIGLFCNGRVGYATVGFIYCQSNTEETPHYYALDKNVVREYQDTSYGGVAQATLVKEYEIPEKGKLEAIEEQLPKIWPNLTAENLSQMKEGDYLSDGSRVIEVNDTSIVFDSLDEIIGYGLQNGELTQPFSGTFANTILGNCTYGASKKIPIDKFYEKLHTGCYLEYNSPWPDALYGTVVVYSELYRPFGGRAYAFGAGSMLAYEANPGDTEVALMEFRMSRIWPSMALQTLAGLSNFNQFKAGDYLGDDLILYVTMTQMIVLLGNGHTQMVYALRGDGTMLALRRQFSFTTSETTYSAASDPEGSVEENETEEDKPE